MIIIGFIFDYLICMMWPVNSYFIVVDLDKNRIFSVIIIGFLLDLIWQKIFINLLLLLCIYLLFKKINIKKKYNFVKNIILYLIYFNITFFAYGFLWQYYFIYLVTGFILQILYLKLCKVLLN